MKRHLLPLLLFPGILLAAQPAEPANLPHPLALKPFRTWLSDTVSPVRQVLRLPDAAYPVAHAIRLDSYECQIRHAAAETHENEEFGYRYLGHTDSGLTGFLTIENGSGSGIFISALIVQPTTLPFCRLDIAGKSCGELTLPVENHPAYLALLELSAGDRTETNTRFVGERFDLAVLATLGEAGNERQIWRESYELVAPVAQ